NFFRIVFKPKDSPLSGKLGREDSVRAFVSPAKYFAGGISVGKAAALLGDRYDAEQDVAIIFCKAKGDERIFDARLATWINLADAITTDLPEYDRTIATVSCTELDHVSDDGRLYCRAQALLKAASQTNERWVAGALGGLYDAVRELLRDQAAMGQLRTRYGVTESFSGLGFSVGGTGGPAAVVQPAEVLGRLTVPEYIVKNVRLKATDCNCVTVAPYERRDNDPLALQWIEAHGTPDCPQVKALGGDL